MGRYVSLRFDVFTNLEIITYDKTVIFIRQNDLLTFCLDAASSNINLMTASAGQDDCDYCTYKMCVTKRRLVLEKYSDQFYGYV